MSQQYETIQVAPMTMNIGAEIDGVDLTKPLSDQQAREIHDALMVHQVVFFRDQPMDFEAHQRFARHYGELVLHTGGFGVEGFPYVVAIHGDANSTSVAGESWHSDLSCNAEPPMGSILHLHTVPPIGGDTLFSSQYAAYDALSDRMKAYLEGLTAVHDGEHVYRPYTNDPNKRFPKTAHPIVRTHPVTQRKCLFADMQYTTHIVGMDKAESDAILSFLFAHCQNVNFQVRFRWKPHSVAFWDNRCVEHHAVWDYFPQTRSGHRVTIRGDVPY
jgi:taurine dioxygenase